MSERMTKHDDPRRGEMSEILHRVTRAVRRRRPRRVGWTLTVNVWPDEIDGGFGAECVELPGCISQGETEEEAVANVLDAIEEILASVLRERREAAAVAPTPEGHRREVKVALSA